MAAADRGANAPGSELLRYKQDLITACINADCLKYGTFTLKSGRVSPYFFNAGLLHRADLLRAVASAFAVTISSQSPALDFDILYGPAYKGIPLAVTTLEKLATLSEDRFGKISYAFDRKKIKTYGDGGIIVGAPLKGKKVFLVDDVMTAGTAFTESVELITKEGGTVMGAAVVLDRMERAPALEGEDDDAPRPSTIQNIRKKFNIPVLSILNLDDIIASLKLAGNEHDLRRVEEYREKYRPSDS